MAYEKFGTVSKSSPKLQKHRAVQRAPRPEPQEARSRLRTLSRLPRGQST